MAFELGPINNFSDSVSIANPAIARLASAVRLGTYDARFYQLMPGGDQIVSQERFEIYSRSLSSKNGTVGAGGWTDSITANAPVTGLTATIGAILKVDDEWVWVSATGTNTVNIIRGVGGTTAASHTAGTAIQVVATAIKDSDLKNLNAYTEETLRYINYTHTMAYVIEWTKKARDLRRKGLDNDSIIAILRQEKMNEAAKDLGWIALNGLKQLGVDGGLPYMTAGLYQQLEDTSAEDGKTRVVKVQNSVGALTEDKLKTALNEVFLTGTPNAIVLNRAYAPLFEGFVSSIRRADVGLTTAGTFVDKYNYEGNILDLVYDSAADASRIAIVNMADCQRGYLTDDVLRLEEEPNPSSREFRESLQGSPYIEINNVGYEHILMNGVSTS